MLTEEHRMLQESLRTFSSERLAPTAAERDRSGEFPLGQLRELGALGAMGVTVSPDWGGAGMDYRSLAVVLEEIAAADGAISTIVSVQNSLACGILSRWGNDAQKERWLRALEQGTALGCFCLTEPHAGSDASAIRTSARRDGDTWVLNGAKQFITTGKHANVAIIFAVTDALAEKKGISCFLVPTNTKGYRADRLEQKLGQHASDTAQVVLEDCRVDADAVMGPLGEGYRIALSNLEAGRIGIAAQSVGMARAALEAAVRYAKERQTFGRALHEHQAVSFRLADMATELEAARQLVWNAASLKDAGESALMAASMAKLFASEMAERVCSAAIQIHGGYGYVRDFPVERIYRDVRVCQIYEGASDIQRMVIARGLVGAASSIS
jgi:butyryl-CoA dehydrogenase